VIAAHFDHGLRSAEESAADRAAVEQLARGLRIATVAGEASNLQPSEAAARDARYRWLATACVEAGATWCATGHTMDDQAETVLLRLTRGTGTSGAAGMASPATWPVGTSAGLRIVRPLLEIRRAEAAAYLAALGIEARVDPSNALDSFDRNRLRHRVLPELRAVNPRAEEAIARFASLVRADDEALEHWAAAAFDELATEDERSVRIERAGLRALPPPIASRVLRRAASAAGLALESGHVETALRLLGRRGARLSVRGGEAVVLDKALLLQRLDTDRTAT
jgi:tRNA(Ile)-lysidine synthase